MEQFISIIISLLLGYIQGRRSKIRKMKKIIANLEIQLNKVETSTVSIESSDMDTCPCSERKDEI